LKIENFWIVLVTPLLRFFQPPPDRMIFPVELKHVICTTDRCRMINKYDDDFVEGMGVD